MTREPLIGDELYSGKASLYYGPVLLAYDQKFNPFDVDELEKIAYSSAKLEQVDIGSIVVETFYYNPMMLFKVRNTDGKKILLCDFASAGSHGTYYKTWFDIENAPPANVRLKSPLNNSISKLARFQWSGPESESNSITYNLKIATDEDFQNVVADIKGIKTVNYIPKKLLTPGEYYFKVIPENKYGSGVMIGKPRRFTIENYDSGNFSDPSIYEFRSEDSLVIGSRLDGNAGTIYGHLETETNIQPAEDRYGNANKSVRFDGTGKIVYSLPYMPEKYSVVCWVKPEGNNVHSQIFSAWSSIMDDPSKIFIHDDSFVAAIENRTLKRTEVVYKGVEWQKWYHLAMVYNGTKFSFYVNGEKIKESNKVKIFFTNAINIYLGGNNNPDGKYFSGCMDDFALFAKVYDQKAIHEIYRNGLDLNNR